MPDTINAIPQVLSAQSVDLDQTGAGRLSFGPAIATNLAESVGPAPDVLKSKLVIGEFVVLSQNYTNSLAQQSLLAENIVKLVSYS